MAKIFVIADGFALLALGFLTQMATAGFLAILVLLKVGQEIEPMHRWQGAPIASMKGTQAG